jgi:hypothetical protein
MKIAIEHRGQELTAEQHADGDRLVTLGDRDVRARYLDYALAELLGVPPGQAIPLATEIVRHIPQVAPDTEE